MLKRPWAVFGDVLDWQLCEPGAIPYFADLNAWSLENGCGCFAVLTHRHSIIDFQLRQFAPAVAPDGFLYHAFERRSPALSWLNAAGYALTMDDISFNRPESVQ